jgi:hypothetical protein
MESFMNETQVSEKIQVSLACLRRWRHLGEGPQYVKVANAIPNAQLQMDVAEAMERATRGIHKAHSLAEEIGDTAFVSVLDRLQIRSMTTIRNLEALRKLVSELEMAAARQAA